MQHTSTLEKYTNLTVKFTQCPLHLLKTLFKASCKHELTYTALRRERQVCAIIMLSGLPQVGLIYVFGCFPRFFGYM